MVSVAASNVFVMVSVVARNVFFMASVVAGNVVYGFRRWFLYGFRRGKERLFMVSVVGFFMVSGCYRTAAVSPMETVKKENTKKETERFQDELSIYIYIYIYIHTYI